MSILMWFLPRFFLSVAHPCGFCNGGAAFGSIFLLCSFTFNFQLSTVNFNSSSGPAAAL
jgi:hypothetical protein